VRRAGRAPLQPALVGELLAGVALGVAAGHFHEALPVLSGLPESEVFGAITDLAIFFLMLLAGLELRPRELVEASGRAIAITAVPVSVKVLMDLGQLKTRLGQTVVSAAVFDDVLSLILLAVLTAVLRTGALPDAWALLQLVDKVALFFLIAWLLGRHVLPRLGRLIRKARAEEFELSSLLNEPRSPLGMPGAQSDGSTPRSLSSLSCAELVSSTRSSPGLRRVSSSGRNSSSLR
jgi:Kef-type K+ transport system membrane component KefB